MSSLPRDVPCPFCGAAVDHGCHPRERARGTANTHAARWRAIGITRPTLNEVLADGEDANRRDFIIRQAVFKHLRDIGKKYG